VNKGLDATYLFTTLDTNSDGRLSKQELRTGLRALQIPIDDRSLDELTIALKRDSAGQFPLRNLLNEIFSPADREEPTLSPRSGSLQSWIPERDRGGAMGAPPSVITSSPLAENFRKLCFGGRDSQSGALEKEAEDILQVQNAMVTLSFVMTYTKRHDSFMSLQKTGLMCVITKETRTYCKSRMPWYSVMSL
jgi:hypothetical protein